MKVFRANLMRLTRPPLPPQEKNNPVHVAIRDVHKTYGPHHVLKGVSLDIYRGKTNLIIGPSGSGKTVLMRQLIRLEKPDSGELFPHKLMLLKTQCYSPISATLNFNLRRSRFIIMCRNT